MGFIGLEIGRKESKLKETGDETFWHKLEAVLFPIAAAIAGGGYIISILVNNPIESVIRSPHALILLALFFAIAFYPLKSLYRFVTSKKSEGK